MKLVIDIPEEMWEWLHNGFLDEDDGKHAINAILKGAPLPKGHGRLIDADEYKRNLKWNENIDNAPTIIEADKTESEDKE